MKNVFSYRLRAFASDTNGATLTELAIIIPVLLLLVFGAVEFGRFGYNETVAQKAMDIAARTAAVRPAVCNGVPDTFQPPASSAGNPPRFGTLCRMDANACAPVPEASCLLSEAAGNATAEEIWSTIAPLVPSGATPANIRIRYTFDDTLGFLGGPYTPIVTAEFENFNYQFITPLGALAGVAGSGSTNAIGNTIVFPSMSASLPAEDLNAGIGG